MKKESNTRGEKVSARISNRKRASVYGRSNNSIYIDGNTVRKIEPRFYEKKRTRKDLRERKSGEMLQIPQVSIGYYLFFLVALTVTAFVCLWYVGIHSNITASQKRVAALESNLSRIKLANDEEYERIAGSIDMEEIKKIAMTELGMKYPGEDQVVRVTMETEDYVRQYEKIPEAVTDSPIRSLK